MLTGHVGARILKTLGVDQVSGVAGESFLPLLEGLRREGIPFLNTAHEAGAAFIALGHARTSGTPGVAAVTRGPGASNALIGVYEAMKSATPMILVVGQVDTTHRHRDGIQEMEVVDVFRPTTKAAIEVTRADRFGPALLAAFRTATRDRPGPVVLSVPTDHLYAETHEVDVPDVYLRPAHGGPTVSSDSLDELAAELETARQVLMIMGPEFRNYRHAKLTSSTARTGGFGVLGAHSCLDVVDTNDPQWIGGCTVRASDHVARALGEADVILSFGSGFGDQTTRGFTETDARLFAFSTKGTAIWDEYLGARHIVADPVSVLEGLVGRLSPDPEVRDARNRWVAGIQNSIAAERVRVFESEREEGGFGIPMSLFVEALDRALPSESLIVSDVGTFNDWFTRYLPFNPGRRYVGPTSNPMGFALPTAIGAHGPAGVARSVVLAGDGGFLMSGMELSTLARLQLPLTVIIFDNRVWGSIARDQDRIYGTRYGTEFETQIEFAVLAQAFGIEGLAVDDPEDLEKAVSWSLEGPGPRLLAVRTDPRRLSPADIGHGGNE